MAKKKTKPAAASEAPAARKSAGRAAAKRPVTSAALRSRLARLDRQLVALVSERGQTLRRLVQLEAKAPQPATIDHRLQEDLAAVAAAVEQNKGPLSERGLRAVFREIVSACRELHTPLRVAYLGPPYSYSHQAAVEHFGQSVELVPVATIAAVFEDVNRKQVEFGLVPIENSTDGRVADTLDMFTRLPVKICHEVQLRIHHNLLGRCARGEIQEVYSRPQALSQCRQWLARHLPAARPIEMTSTAAAAQLAAEKPGAAAIASLQAAANYGLDVLAANIEDNPNNITRFAVIGSATPRRTGQDKTAVMFHVEHRPGALADAMNLFKRAGLNLTWIESFPMLGSENEYLFFVELEGYYTDARVRKALSALERKAVRVALLGSYSTTRPRG